MYKMVRCIKGHQYLGPEKSFSRLIQQIILWQTALHLVVPQSVDKEEKGTRRTSLI